MANKKRGTRIPQPKNIEVKMSMNIFFDNLEIDETVASMSDYDFNDGITTHYNVRAKDKTPRIDYDY
jgi:hypothetical protein